MVARVALASVASDTYPARNGEKSASRSPGQTSQYRASASTSACGIPPCRCPLKDANKLFDVPDFNDDSKLGSGKEKVDRLTNLVAIFENPALDFSKNRADGDDILGDAYEYLMRHFATESGKSKGQFYTPAEVSRVIAQVIGIRRSKPTAQTTVYDPTCGSGSLLLKVADEAGAPVTLYGQERTRRRAGSHG